MAGLGVFQPNVFQNNVFQVQRPGGGNSATKDELASIAKKAERDALRRKQREKKRLADEARKAKAAEAQEQVAEPAQEFDPTWNDSVIAGLLDQLSPAQIDPNGPVPPVEPIPDMRAPPLPASFLQDQKDQQDAMDIIVLLATSPETSRLLATA